MAYTAAQLVQYRAFLDANGEIDDFTNAQVLTWSNARAVPYRPPQGAYLVRDLIQAMLDAGVWIDIANAAFGTTVTQQTSAKLFYDTFIAANWDGASIEIDDTKTQQLLDLLRTQGVISANVRNAIDELPDTLISRVENEGLPPAQMIDVRRARQL